MAEGSSLLNGELCPEQVQAVLRDVEIEEHASMSERTVTTIRPFRQTSDG
jgi:hypothetical protein